MTTSLRLRVNCEGLADLLRFDDGDATVLLGDLTADDARDLLLALDAGLGDCLVCQRPCFLDLAHWCRRNLLPVCDDCLCSCPECRADQAVAI